MSYFKRILCVAFTELSWMSYCRGIFLFIICVDLVLLCLVVTSFLCCVQQNRTPLHIAVSNHHANVVRLLLDSGCDLDIPDKVRIGDMLTVTMMRGGRF